MMGGFLPLIICMMGNTYLHKHRKTNAIVKEILLQKYHLAGNPYQSLFLPLTNGKDCED